MKVTDKVKVFEKELELIRDNKLRNFIAYCLDNSPEYIYKIPASSTGRYHPLYALGDGGLVRHIKASCKFAKFVCESMYYTECNGFDTIIASLLLHDVYKNGVEDSGSTLFTHPLISQSMFRINYYAYIEQCPEFKHYQTEQIDEISYCIATHMGRWNTNIRYTVELPKPQNTLEKIVNMCDYMASRKELTVNFSDEDDYEYDKRPMKDVE